MPYLVLTQEPEHSLTLASTVTRDGDTGKGTVPWGSPQTYTEPSGLGYTSGSTCRPDESVKLVKRHSANGAFRASLGGDDVDTSLEPLSGSTDRRTMLTGS